MLHKLIELALTLLAILFLAAGLALLVGLAAQPAAGGSGRPDPCALTLDLTPDAPAKVSAADLRDLSRTIWAESRSENLCGQIAVGFVALNRTIHDPEAWGSTVSAAVRKPFQFEPWTGTASRKRLEALDVSDPAYLTATLAASLVLTHAVADPSQGAVFFHSLAMVPPRWARHAGKPIAIGNHIFYSRKN